MKKIDHYLKATVLLSFVFLFSMPTIGQETTSEYASIKFYRPKKPMHTGVFGIRIFVNEIEIGVLYENATMEYRVYEGDSANVKCIGNFANGRVGSPFTAKIDLKKGEESSVALSILMMTMAVKGEVLVEGEKKDEIVKKKYLENITVDERELKRDKLKQENAKSGKSKADKLKELKELLNEELITQEEYDEAREKIINE